MKEALTPDRERPLGEMQESDVVLVGEAACVVEAEYAKALHAEGYQLGRLFDSSTALHNSLQDVAFGLTDDEAFGDLVVVHGRINHRFGRAESRVLDVPFYMRNYVPDSFVVYVPVQPLSDEEKGHYISSGYSALIEYDPHIERVTTAAAKMLTALTVGPQRVIYPTLYSDELPLL
jgi:hypothetical protein